MEADLSELDDWLGTLEELQLGLELCHSVTETRSKLNSVSEIPQNLAVSSSSCTNRNLLNELIGPAQKVTRAVPSAHFNPVSTESAKSPMGRFPSSPYNHPDSSKRSTVDTNVVNGKNGWTHENRLASADKPPIGTTVSRSAKEATAEQDLSCLLQELEVVEARMKELETENTTFTRRYSLASSPHGKRLCDQLESTDFTTSSNSHNINSNENACTRPQLAPSYTNGFVSAQWAAQLNPEINDLDREQSCSPPPPPPAFLGAGDACVSPPTSPQPHTPSLSMLQQTEAGIWSINAQNMAPRESNVLAGTAPQPPTSTPKPILNTSTSIDRTCRLLVSQADPNLNNMQVRQGISYVTKEASHRSDNVAGKSNLQAVTCLAKHASCGSVKAVDVTRVNQRLDFFEQNTVQPVEKNVQQSHQTRLFYDPSQFDPTQPSLTKPDLLYVSTSGSHRNLERNADGDEESSLSGVGSWSPGQANTRHDLVKTNSFVGHGGSDGQSNSLSPESSLSDKSIPESVDSNHRTVVQSNTTNEGQLKKLVVRIFRPDRTTKAILIEEQMTAGEVASMMIEKNFLPPSTRLVVVEKVPALKIERVFEEHEKVADCILSWPTRSQNMLFFEERDDHFGLIESPGDWLGEEFVKKYQYETAEAMQMMLNNIEQAGFPEWRDYLYIRKPGDKTWSRRLCVLRSSGLYTSKKNRKLLNPTDLIRILVLDSHLQLYTTTGGWTRMRAPTPHGFAFKPYSAQDPASTHVFCFCATDEKALRQWVARLRIAKYGRQLYLDYQSALGRVQRQLTMRHGSFGMNGSLSAGVHRKSSFDFLSTSSNPALTTTGSSTSLVTRSCSPSVPKRYIAVHSQAGELSSKQPENERHPQNHFQKQTTKTFQHTANSPSCSETQFHVGLRPQTSQYLLDQRQAHYHNRIDNSPLPSVNSNSHFSGNSSNKLSRSPGSVELTQLGFRRK